MSPHHARRAAATAVVLALGLLAGCGGSSGGRVAETTDGRVSVRGTGTRAKATITGDGSTVTYGTGAVPAGFPAAVPLPSGAGLGTTASGARGATQYFQLDYLPAGSATKALAAYGRQLTDAGFTVTPGPDSTLDAGHDGWKVRAVATAGSRPILAVTVTNA